MSHPNLDWPRAIEIVRPFTVRVTTPEVSGTGFFLADASRGDLCGVATAAHVVNQAFLWEQPIRIEHPVSGETRLLRGTERAILVDQTKDTAAIVFRKEGFPFPATQLQLFGLDSPLPLGHRIGWLGFPGVAKGQMCFFSGHISSWLTDKDSYLVDGVAINGVSGGPTFYLAPDEPEPRIIGCLSAYLPNRVTGEALPGLAIVTGVAEFREVVAAFDSFDEAKGKEPPAPDFASRAK